ncbi:MAG: LysR family transcriptional regulator [Thiobacillus sp.]|uniref:LysR family transcriptional regulator n=1 Tax=unclassified Thiobacillus TaxID=2646513 RepID=UPI00086F469C|nr:MULTISPECIES: LysR family transcriptional regulator [unclassified Thiobacillus]MBN8770099.1 LysR family transcriptional regulator [Thiobacillus sp.]MBN8780679.1 LysR family transcriptional regulator [Thiobacillus sp.]ODU99609.1 MAG: LysR family transcriptional regulator [Thiobacillus sp. SCN 63-57]OJY57853.1 MAG: LysR family transcriptional regulator [Thiobacillus sp. 0-1251]
MDRLDSMRLFVRVAELGSFSAVAQQMNVARSVVTRQVAALEAHLGTKLLARSTRRLSLTSAGATYLEKCREILGLVDAAEAGLTEDSQAPRGHLRITLPFSFGIRQLMPMFGDFMVANPEITIELEFSDRRTNLIEGGFDLAIRITDRLEPGDVARKIGSSRSVVVAAPGYIKRHGRPRHPKDLIRHECFGYVLATRSSWAFSLDGKTEWFPVAGRLEANSGDALLAAAIGGLGITYLPTFIVETAVREHSLDILLPAFRAPELGIYAVFPSNRYVPHRVRALVEYLAQRIGSKPPWDEILPKG